MAFGLTKFAAYGIEADEPLTTRFKQYAVFEITGTTADIAYDFGAYAGTFWTAVGATEPGITALKAIKDIAIRAKTSLSVLGGVLIPLAKVATASASTNYSLASGSSAAVIPSLLFFTANGPTSAILVLEWELKENETPVKVTKTA